MNKDNVKYRIAKQECWWNNRNIWSEDNEIEILELSLIDDVTDSLLDDDGDLDSDGVIDNELECEIEC